MSMRVMIGQAVEPYWPEGAMRPTSRKWTIEYKEPVRGPPTGYSARNLLHVGRTEFKQAMNEAGLGAHFASARLLPRVRICRITQSDVVLVEDALHRWRRNHPETEFRLCRCAGCRGEETDGSVHDERSDRTGALLEWLAYWMRWALVMCDKPAILHK